ncbi:MAG: hypothetical protein IJR47_02780, partial [Clostridia bacterium]|nr:hypothetical protein [Clostridia bacterium]
MKSIIKKAGMTFAAILTIIFCTTFVFAGKEIDVPGVKQGDNGKTFAKDAPIVSILFDNDLIAHEKNAELKFLNEEEYPGFVAMTAERDNMPGWNAKRDDGHTFVVYDERVQGAKALAKNDMNTFYGDIFSYTYRNAAILEDKSRAHIVLTYSNISIPLQTNLGESTASNYDNLNGWTNNNGI